MKCSSTEIKPITANKPQAPDLHTISKDEVIRPNISSPIIEETRQASKSDNNLNASIERSNRSNSLPAIPVESGDTQVQNVKSRVNLGINLPKTPTSSPTISPRYWQPVKPGYHSTGAQAVHKTGQRCRSAESSSSIVTIQNTLEIHQYEGSLRDSIPSMPKFLAVFCFVCNVSVPGLGTLISGLSILGRSKIRGGGDALSVIWINTCVTLLQILTTPLLLFGWMWSIYWGMSFVSFARDDYDTEGQNGSGSTTQEEDNQQNAAMRRAITRARRDGSYPNPCSTQLATSITFSNLAPNPPPSSIAINQRQQQKQCHSSHPHLSRQERGLSAIIVLNEPPILEEPVPAITMQSFTSRTIGGGSGVSSRTLNPNNPRHQHVLRRQGSLDIINHPIVLDPDSLETFLSRSGLVNSSTSEKL